MTGQHSPDAPPPAPPIDPQAAVDVVTDCWRRAAAQVWMAWPGPMWELDYQADDSAQRIASDVAICQAAGLDVTPLLDRWEVRYREFRVAGGRARFRSIGRALPLPNPTTRSRT